MPALPERRRRQEHRRVSIGERRNRGMVSIGIDQAEINRVFDEVRAELGAIADVIPERASKQLAQEIKGGRSAWPVWTGYSRGRFRGDERGIINDASYAPAVEEDGTRTAPPGTATEYVNNHIARVANEIVEKSVAEG